MLMGTVLVQPQRVRRARTADPLILLASDIFSLGARLAFDADHGGRIAAIAGEALQAAFDRLVTDRLAVLDGPPPRLTQFATALAGKVGLPLAPLLDVNGPAGIGAAAKALVDRLAAAADGLTAAAIRPYVVELLDILDQELGLSLQAIDRELWGVVEAVVAALEAAEPEPDAEARENRLDAARVLRRIEKLARSAYTLPALDPDRIAAELASVFRKSGLGKVAREVACAVDGGAAVLDAVLAATEVVPAALAGTHSLGAAAAADAAKEQYLWYASWLLDKDVVLNAERTQIKKGDEVLAEGTNLTMADIPAFKESTTPHYRFGHPWSLEMLEMTAWISAISTEGLNTLFHLLSLEEGDYASNIANATVSAALGTLRGIIRQPFVGDVAETFGLGPALTFPFTFEGIHTKASFKNCFLMWLTLALPDLGEAIIYRLSLSGVRDGILSTLTLWNNETKWTAGGSPDTRTLNRKHGEALAAVGTLVGGKVLLAIFPREDYAQPFQSGDQFVSLVLVWSLVLSPLFTFLGWMVGAVGAACVGRAFDTAELFKKPKTWSWWLINWIMFWVNLYMSKEGDTDDGHYNPNGAAFAGYPDKASSPYSLPYPKDQSVYVGQANQGVFSHNFINSSQIYAVDFSMDQDDVILATRPGTVADYFDWVANDTDPDASEQAAAAAEAAASGFLLGGQTNSDAWNFIAIRHDVDEAGNQFLPDDHPTVSGAVAAAATTLNLAGSGLDQLWGGDLFTVAGGAVHTITSVGPVTKDGAGVFNGVTFTPAAPPGGFADGAAVTLQPRIRPDPVHDRGPGGAVQRMYSVYGHGRKDSVRGQFTTRGVASNQIIGQVVRRGEPIMLAGDTGVSFHNHLHYYVLPGPPPPGPPAVGSGVVARSNYGNCIPFVFRDVSPKPFLYTNDGVPYHLDFYTSTTVQVP